MFSRDAFIVITHRMCPAVFPVPWRQQRKPARCRSACVSAGDWRVCFFYSQRFLTFTDQTPASGRPAAPRPDDERQVGERLGGRNGLHRGSAAAAEEPERLAELQRRLLEGHGEDVREENHDPGRPEPRPQPRRQPAGQQAGQPGRGAGSAAERDGGAASAGHVPAVPAVVAPRVHPGVQGQLPGPERRLQPQHDGERLLRRGRRVLRRARRHSHRGTAGRRRWRRDSDDGSGQEWEQHRQG